MNARYTNSELLALANDNGPQFVGSAKQALKWAADTLDAANVAVSENLATIARLTAEVERLRGINSGLVDKANHYLIRNTRLEEEVEALRAWEESAVTDIAEK